jgi:hypothetical protein
MAWRALRRGVGGGGAEDGADASYLALLTTCCD